MELKLAAESKTAKLLNELMNYVWACWVGTNQVSLLQK